MPTFRPRAVFVPLGLIAVSGVIAGCGGSSSGGGTPSPSASAATNAPIGQLSVLREPMSYARAKAAEPKLHSLPGVVQIRYSIKSHELFVYLSPQTTVRQRQRIVEAIANAANQPVKSK